MPQTLLLADDSVTIQRVIELTFADEDIRVVAVSDGDQAIASIEASPPDIVLADIGMPGRTGYEVAQYIKSSPRLAHIPVVLLTGAFEPVDQARAAEAGCDGVLAKPFEPQLVIQRVKELLSRPRTDAVETLDEIAHVALPPVLTVPAEPAPEPWAPTLAEPAAVSMAPKPPTSSADVESYFDRLDAAFANLSGSPLSAGATPRPAPDPIIQLDHIAPRNPMDDDAVDIDWFEQKPEISAAPVSTVDFPLAVEPVPLEVAPVSVPEPVPVREPEPAPAPESEPEPDPAPLPDPEPPPEPEREPPAPPLPPLSASMPSLADAFAALLTAEQRVGPPVWPTGPSPEAPAAALDLEQLTSDVTARVLDLLAARSDQIVREAVADRVSEIAERLVRDEIERIKNSIK